MTPMKTRRLGGSGVTFFDTAEAYGPFANEELVGEAQVQGDRYPAHLQARVGR